MELDESSHILDHAQLCAETPESTSDVYQLVEDEEHKAKNKSNIPMASFNFINSIIGSGIIGMPYALKQAGFGMGILLMIFVACITDYSLVLLIHAGELSGAQNYQDVMRAAFGRPGFYLLTVMQFLYPFIAMISYNVIIGDTITKIVVRIGGDALHNTILGNRQFVTACVCLVCLIPLSLYKNIARLSKASFVSVVLVLFIFVVMLVKNFELNLAPTEDAYRFVNWNITSAIGIMAFAYMCHHNSFLIYDSLITPTEKRWGTVTHISVSFAALCTLALGVTGYVTFTGYTQGDVLENYCHKDDWANGARFVFAVTIMLTFPIECFVCREVLENAIFINVTNRPLWRHITITIVIVVATVLISMTTDCLGIVLELNGVMNACPLAYIFPPLCVMRLQQEPILSTRNIPPLLVMSFGVLVAVVGVIMAIVQMVQGVNCSHGAELPYCAATVPTYGVLNTTLNATLAP